MEQNPSDLDKQKIMTAIKENIIKKSSDELSEENLSNLEMSESEHYRTGRWQPTEHVRFIKGCLQYGNNWKKVIIFIENLKFFLPKNKKNYASLIHFIPRLNFLFNFR
jgi:hypothetical protein